MEFAEALNRFGRTKTPLFFIVDYKKERYEIHPLEQLPEVIRFHKKDEKVAVREHIPLHATPITFDEYREKFDRVLEEIAAGNSYMLNLTQRTKIETKKSLEDIYLAANSLFNLYYRDEFVCFTPERFVEIEGSRIYTYPMKGTISSSIPNAKAHLLNSQKESAEHVMVVDLLRNDLGIIARDVKVESFRHIDKICLDGYEIYQSSSTISAKLEEGWRERIGDILDLMLPAGSITGTPKSSSCRIIDKIEEYERGFFTGVAGIYDGKSLESYVLIRFIEKDADGLWYKSGGGITADSNPREEYQEMIEKIYVPTF